MLRATQPVLHVELALPASWGIGEDRLESRLAETRFPVAATHLDWPCNLPRKQSVTGTLVEIGLSELLGAEGIALAVDLGCKRFGPCIC